MTLRAGVDSSNIMRAKCGQCPHHLEGCTMESKRTVSALALGAAALWAFGALPGTGQSRGGAAGAIERFWAIYHGNDYAAIPEAQAALRAAIARAPDNPTLYALL